MAKRKEKTSVPEHFPNAAYDVIGVASSAGGLTALTRIISALPAKFPGAIVIVQHLDPRHRSLMAEILNRHTPLLVEEASGGELLTSGAIYIAPPNQHLLVNPDGSLSLSRSWCTLSALPPTCYLSPWRPAIESGL
jgi:two-component system, chemotaxis family, protein-glutamate methylesterase/glutaminase